MEEAPYNDRETDSDKEDGEDDFPGDVVGEYILSCEQQDDADGDEAEAHDFVVIGDEADDARYNDEESPPAIKEDVEAEKPEGVATEDNTEGDNCDTPNNWFDLFHF